MSERWNLRVCGMTLALGAAALMVLPAWGGGAGENLFPTGKGSSWAFTGTVAGRQMNETAIITTSKRSGGKTTVVMRWTLNGQPVQDETYIVTASQVARARSGPYGSWILQPPLPVIKYPMASGKSWNWQGKITMTGQISAAGTASLRVGAREKVKTPMGVFNAYPVQVQLTIRVGSQTQTTPNTYWFAPGVGMIQQKATLTGASGKSITIQLAVSKYAVK